MTQPSFQQFASESPVVPLSGGFGTTLQLRGFQATLPLWSAAANLTHPHLIQSVHEEFCHVGARVLSTNSFRTAPHIFERARDHFQNSDDDRSSLRRMVLEDYKAASLEATKLSVRSAKAAAAKSRRPIYVAGSYGPYNSTHSAPAEKQDATKLLAAHRDHARVLVENGVDFLLPEAVPTRAEAVTMAQAASETRRPFVIGFTLDPTRGTLFDGTEIEEAVRVTSFPERIGIVIHCTPAAAIGEGLDQVLKHSKGLVGAYANGGGKDGDGATWHHDASHIPKLVGITVGWHDKDPSRVKLLGFCCGGDPEHIKALNQSLNARVTPKHIQRSAGAVQAPAFL